MKFAVGFTKDSKAIPVDFGSGTGTGASVLYIEQSLTPEQKAQARANIGVTGYYSTEREEIGVSHENINTAYIWGLYDALMAEHPDNVQKNPITNDDGTFTNYEYVISTGEYSTEGMYAEAYGANTHIKKKKFLVMSAIHGTERMTAFSTYRFIRDILSGHNVLKSFREGAIISVLPIGTPSAFNNFTRQSDNAVDINRNFDWNWKSGTKTDFDGNNYTYGASAASEKETQAIKNWLDKNKEDASLFIDFHNSGRINENVAILGLPNNTESDTAMRTALRGIDNVISYWKDVIGYPNETKIRDGQIGKYKFTPTLFSYTASLNPDNVGGLALQYAHYISKIRSLGIETAIYYADCEEYDKNWGVYHPESIAMGAEALGNILIEFYEGEVNDMSEIGNKLDTLIESVNRGFHSISGTLVVTEDKIPAEGSYAIEQELECPANVKLISLYADDDTVATIKTTTGVNYTMGFVYSTATPIVPVGTANKIKARTWMDFWNNGTHVGWRDSSSTLSALTSAKDEKFKFNSPGLKVGTYNWTAYYWNE